MMNYQQALDYFYSFLDSERKLHRTPAEFNLPRTTALLDAFGNPQQTFKSVVIAGTKGKGSTAAMLEAIIRSAGYRTGLWTSPHLHSYRERIQVDRQYISQAEFIALVEMMQPMIEQFAEMHPGLTTFELGFALALTYFAQRQIEVAVLEIGLGGRYDSVNAVTPVLSVIASISYDHMHILGNTLTQIAYDKAGIIKPGVPVITIPQVPEAMSEIGRVAGEVGGPLWVAERPTLNDERRTGGRERLSLLVRRAVDAEVTHTMLCYTGSLETALRGSFQHENACLSAGAALLLRDAGLRITDDAIAYGLATVQWPGRFEIVPGRPPIVLDGAHNGDSAHKLVRALDEKFPDRRLVLVLGLMKDKDFDRILPELVSVADVLVLTYSRHHRALKDLAWLADRAEPWMWRGDGHIDVVLTCSVSQALEEARKIAGPEDLICVTGTLPVVAEAREALGLALEID